MTQKFLLPVVGVAMAVALSSCVAPEPAPQPLRRGSYSLDQPASRGGASRYQEDRVNERRSSSSSSTSETRGIDYEAPAESGNASTDSTRSNEVLSSESASPSTPAPLVDTPKVDAPTEVAPVTPPPAVNKPKQPAYASPVMGRRGFVYPPGVEQKPDNMIDVRDFAPGSKARDPKTGTIFLVP